jgi:hypothetical protein
MPKFLEAKLKKQYPNNPNAVYGTLNAIGAMQGNKETAKGRAMDAKHKRDVKSGKASDTQSHMYGKRKRGKLSS